MAAGVIEQPCTISEQEAATVRRCLHLIADRDRRVLWQCLILLERNVRHGTRASIEDAIGCAPAGPIRTCVADIARLHANDRQLAGSVISDAALPAVKRRPLSTIYGRLADPDCWTTTPWTWRSFAPEALSRLADSRQQHRPLEVLYSHAGPALGLTRQFIGCEDGGLDCELWLMPTRRAQVAGEYVRAGLLDGLSIGVRVYRSTCDYLSPREWEPA
jgi:hypothetical protein